MNRILRNTIFYLLIFLVIIAVVSVFTKDQDTSEQITYDEFISQLEQGNVQKIRIQPERQVYVITGQLNNYEDNQYFTVNALNNPQDLAMITSLALEKGTVIETIPAAETSGWLQFLTSMIPFLILLFFIFFLLNQSQGSGGRVMNFGKSKAKLYSQDKKKVRFNDVAGADEEKQELIEIVEFLKDPRKFSALGARIPKGVLLVGPPGTGKTLLARAVAGEAGVPFFSISGSDFVEMFVGVGASRVRDLFETAKKHAPCIIFIDEIDAVGRQRGAGLGGGHDEREQTLNQLLVEMDGFSENEGIIVMAATRWG